MNLQALKDEFTNDPLTRGYTAMLAGADPFQKTADDLNTEYRAGPQTAAEVLKHMMLQKFRTNVGSDMVNSNLYGRLQMAAEGTVGSDTFGSGTHVLALQEKHACATFIRALGPDSGFVLSLFDDDFDSILTRVRQAEVFGTGDKDAIQALSDNKMSRAVELVGGHVSGGDVEEANALP